MWTSRNYTEGKLAVFVIHSGSKLPQRLLTMKNDEQLCVNRGYFCFNFQISVDFNEALLTARFVLDQITYYLRLLYEYTLL